MISRQSACATWFYRPSLRIARRSGTGSLLNQMSPPKIILMSICVMFVHRTRFVYSACLADGKIQISPAGHKLTADVAIAYIDQQLCELDNEEREVPVPSIPPVGTTFLPIGLADFTTETPVGQVGSNSSHSTAKARVLLHKLEEAHTRGNGADWVVSSVHRDLDVLYLTQ